MFIYLLRLHIAKGMQILFKWEKPPMNVLNHSYFNNTTASSRISYHWPCLNPYELEITIVAEFIFSVTQLDAEHSDIHTIAGYIIQSLDIPINAHLQ